MSWGGFVLRGLCPEGIMSEGIMSVYLIVHVSNLLWSMNSAGLELCDSVYDSRHVHVVGLIY